MTSELFQEISIIIAIGAAVGLLMHLLRQPLIIGHIITGILIGPSLLNILQSQDTVEVFAKIGITLLLFIIGLGLNPRVIKEVGKVSALTGIGQVLFTAIIGFGLIKLLGYSTLEGIYIALALAFSSTIIILKLLTDKKEQGRLYGKIAIGFLLVQDVIATIVLIIAATLGDKANISSISFPALVLNGVVLVSFLYLISTRALPVLSRFIANSQEMLFLFALGWGLGIASLFAALGFSLEVGALFAGVAMASTVYAQEVAAKLRPLRDFFIVLFFISLGASLGLASLGDVLINGIWLSLFVLIGNPIIVMLIMGILGYTRKTSFKAGLTVAQISEFSLVLILLGRDTGSLDESIVSLITVVALITIALSTYMIIYVDKIYKVLENRLSLFERRKVRYDQEGANRYQMILFGYNKGGNEFVKVFKSFGKPFVVVDYDPEVVDRLVVKKINHLYGDATDPEMHEEIGSDSAKLIVSTISDVDINRFLINHVRSINPQCVIICPAEKPEEAVELYDLGATYVMMPHYIGSEKISSFIRRNGFKRHEFEAWRDRHLLALKTHLQHVAERSE